MYISVGAKYMNSSTKPDPVGSSFDQIKLVTVLIQPGEFFNIGYPTKIHPKIKFSSSITPILIVKSNLCTKHNNDVVVHCAKFESDLKTAKLVKSKGYFARYDFKSSPPSAAYMRQWTGPSSVQVMACRLFGAKPLPEPMMA